MHEQPVQLSVNGTPIAASVEPRMTLATSYGTNADSPAPISAVNTARAVPAQCFWTAMPCGRA